MKKALALILAAIMLLCTASFAVADEAQTVTVVAWDANDVYLVAEKAAFEASHPGVTVEYVDVASQDYMIKATTTSTWSRSCPICWTGRRRALRRP